MERIVTKIGDVTIERRVSKSQQSKIPQEATGSNLQHPTLPKIIPSNKDEEVRPLPQELANANRNIPKPPLSNRMIGEENVDLRTTVSSNKSDTQENFTYFPDPEDKSQQNNPNNSSQYSHSISFEFKNSGASLPKVPKVDPVQCQSRSLVNGPDLSKLVGVSIERRKRTDFESQHSKMELEESADLMLNALKEGNQVRPDINLDDEEYDESFDEEDFEGDPIPPDDEDMEMPEVVAELSHPEALSQESLDKNLVINKNDTAKKNINEFQEPEAGEVDEENKEKSKEQFKECKKESDINDLACTDLVELMQKGEIEGEIEEVKDEEEEEEEDDNEDDDEEVEEEEEGEEEEEIEEDEESQKKKVRKRKAIDEEGDAEKKDVGKRKKKKKKKTEKKGNDLSDEENEDDEEDKDKEKNIDKSKITNANLRKNIREVMDETKLDEATLAAQRQEAERLKRLQEQQRIIREVQRQISLNRQNQKSQSKILSLLQGNSQTSILKTSAISSQAQAGQVKAQNSVLVKRSNGEQTSLSNRKMLELLKNSKNKPELGTPPISRTLLKQGMVTPSVTIAPIIKKESSDDDKKKKRDIVTLSSDSEDDCIVLSDEDESEPEEDPTNSGMHTNDKYNLPDEKGRVIVNVGHPESEVDLYLAPQIARIIKPHQIGGIRFLYDNVIESIDRFQSSAGFGCILAHSMGLGKTLQIVSFSDIFLRYTPAKTILCIMPINTIQNWLAEFNMWLPKESSSEDIRCRDFDLFIVNESLKNLNARAKVILDWHKSGGVLLMGYELFRLLSLKKLNKSKKKKKDPEEENAKNKELIEEVFSALVLPGPDLVICDEGHRIKNSHATTSQALKQIRTKRRIVLTGYPLQNNLMEYWCMVDFVRPNYLGTKTEFSNMFERPIQNGQCIDSTPQDKRLMRYRAHVLHSLLEGFVQRRSHAVLQSALPEKEEYVLLLRFTPFQRKLYDTFMNEVVRTVAVPNPLKAFAVCCKIWNHPDVLYNFLKKKGEEIDLDLEEALPPSLQTPLNPYGQHLMGPEGMNQQGQIPGVPWPKRGPGSRGGKVRQPTSRRVGRGRKPAASIPPNVMTSQEKSEPLNPGQFHGSGNFINQQQEGAENYQGRNYNQNQFGFNNERGYQSGGYSNSNYNKNPLNNLENMSSGDFQNKNFFPHQNITGNQGQFGNPCQNFDSGHLDPSFNPNSSNESNLNTSFESNLNSGDSSFNQNEFNAEFNSEFYPNNNFQNAGSNSNFSPESKSGFQGNNSYFPNPGFRNSENFDYQNRGNNMDRNFQNYDQSNSNFQNASSNPNFQNNNNFQNSSSNQTASRNQGSHFQNSSSNQTATRNQGSHFQNSGNRFQESNSNSGSNFQQDFQGSNSSFDGNRSGNFPGRNPGNFQEESSTFGENFQGQNRNSNFQGNNYDRGYWEQSNWEFQDTSKGSGEFRNDSGNDFMSQKFNSFDENQEGKSEEKPCGNGNNNGAMYNKSGDYQNFGKSEIESKFSEFEEGSGSKGKEEEEDKKEEIKSVELQAKKEDPSLPYDWATDLFKTYVTGVIENSSKMEVFFHIVTESIKLGDRLLVFSQSLLTLDLIENYLQHRNVPDKEEVWAKNKNYFRLDGSTPGLEREKLINEFNANSKIYLFLVSTRAGSLGINLVGANRVVVFDASWNPCHDTQAVCRVYRYGQRKQCFVYRLVMDSCLEKKIYDRQVNKQGMADRVVDELNPDAHLSIKEVTNLCWDDQQDTTIKDFSHLKDKYRDEIIKYLLERCSKLLSKEPFQHESLLIDRKEKKLSQAEKRLAKRSYELEKQAANQPKNIYSFFPNPGQRNFVKPIASVRPMQSEINSRINPQFQSRSKWIPAEVWQKQGMSAQEMTLPLDVVIPTSSPEKTSIVLKAGQRVMVLKSPKGIYMQLENGKIIAIRSAFKVGQNGPGGTATTTSKQEEVKKDSPNSITPTGKTNVGFPPKIPPQSVRSGALKQPPFMKPFNKVLDKKMPVNMTAGRSRQVMGKAKPFILNRKYENISSEMKQRLMRYGNPEENFTAGTQRGAEERQTGSEKTQPNTPECSVLEERIFDSVEEKTEKPEDKIKMNDSLETLRKVTESISDSTKREDLEGDKKCSQINLKNYRHNFSSQIKEGLEEEKKNEKKNESLDEKKDGNFVTQNQGNENVQNWLMNQSYPPMDPYGNYFPGYYYGPGPGPMMPPYDGFYPPSNYPHPMGCNSPVMPTKQLAENPKGNPQPVQPPPAQNNQNTSGLRNPPVVNTPPMYPPYPNPYPYPYNYPGNPGFNNQGYSFPGQNQSSQQFSSQNPSQNNPCNSNQSYDTSMYSAFHRPDAPFQNPENPYPSPYPRPPYPSSGTPGFFPYNPPYPNYPYGPNFNPYMHPGSYGYPMQNPPPVNNHNQNPNTDMNLSSNNSGSANAS